MAKRRQRRRKPPPMTDPRGGQGGAARPVDPLPALDLTEKQDRQLLRRAVSQGWGLTPIKLGRAAQLLEDAEKLARVRADERAMRGCVDLWLRIAAQVQSDEHLDAKLAAGMVGDGQDITIRVVRE